MYNERRDFTVTEIMGMVAVVAFGMVGLLCYALLSAWPLVVLVVLPGTLAEIRKGDREDGNDKGPGGFVGI